MIIASVMTRNPLYVRPEMTVTEVRELMTKEKVGKLPVLDKHDNLVGIVTKKDLVNAGPSAATTLDMYEISYLLSKLKVEKVMEKNVVTVKTDGTGDYYTVIDAVNSEPEDTTILIYEGTYEGTIQAFQKRIVLIGVDRDKCILKSYDGRYSFPAINCSCGYIENLTIISKYIQGISNEIDDQTNGAYAVHCENEYGVGKSLELHNCILKSDFFPAIGIGLRKDFNLILDNCELENNQIVGRGGFSDVGSLGALYFHDSNGQQGNQYISVKDCVLNSMLGNTMTIYQVERNVQKNKVYCDFINNVLEDKIHGFSNNIWFRGDPFNESTGIYEIRIGYGNTNTMLNNSKGGGIMAIKEMGFLNIGNQEFEVVDVEARSNITDISDNLTKVEYRHLTPTGSNYITNITCPESGNYQLVNVILNNNSTALYVVGINYIGQVDGKNAFVLIFNTNVASGTNVSANLVWQKIIT
jgi:hypothetical protein